MTNAKERHASKPEAEFSDYQKEIEATDNVILCVAKAEKMIRAIGASLYAEQSSPVKEPAKPDAAFEDYE
jgi:hypothetical protein